MRSEPPERRWTSSIQYPTSSGPCSWLARVSTTGGLVLVPPALSTPEPEQAETARASATAASRVKAGARERRRCITPPLLDVVPSLCLPRIVPWGGPGRTPAHPGWSLWLQHRAGVDVPLRQDRHLLAAGQVQRVDLPRGRLPVLGGGADVEDGLAVRREPRMRGPRSVGAVVGQRAEFAAVRPHGVQLALANVEVAGRVGGADDHGAVR